MATGTPRISHSSRMERYRSNWFLFFRLAKALLILPKE